MSIALSATSSSSLKLGEDFPLACDECLGGSYVRMTRTPNGVECKISKRPCTLFEWRANGVKRATCIDYLVAAQKNLCQCCMKDLTFNLPMSVRDAFLKAAAEKGIEGAQDAFMPLPKSQVGKDVLLRKVQAQIEQNANGTLMLEDQGTSQPEQPGIMTLVNSVVHHIEKSGDSRRSYSRLPMLCSDWLDKKCTKGPLCLKRPCCGAFIFPELNREDEKVLVEQLQVQGPQGVMLDASLKGLLQKKLNQQKAANEAHEKRNIGNHGNVRSNSSSPGTLYISNLAKGTTEQSLRNALSKFRGLQRVSIVDDAGRAPYAFAQFSSHAEAKFVLDLGRLNVGGSSVTMAWAKDSADESTSKGPNVQRRDDRVGFRDGFARKDEHGMERKRHVQSDRDSGNDASLQSDSMKKPKMNVAPAASAASQALINAMALRKNKGLDDEE